MSLQIFQNIVDSALGYGGWIGLALVPFLWDRVSSMSQRVMVLFVTPPAFAFVMTAIVSMFYGLSLFSATVFGIMSNPMFIRSMCSSLAFMMVTISGTVLVIRLKEFAMEEATQATEEVVEEEDNATEEVVEEEDNATEEEKESLSNVDTSPLRNAPPLPDTEIA